MPEDRWMPDAFAAVLNAQNGKLREKYLAQRVSKSSATAASTQKANADQSHGPQQHGSQRAHRSCETNRGRLC
jgi:hypothetical protein